MVQNLPADAGDAEMRVRWLDSYHNGPECEQTPGDSGGQRSLACCGLWGHRAGHYLATEQQQRCA